MRLHQPWLVKGVGFVASVAMRLWLGSLRYRFRALGPDLNPHRTDLAGRFIYVMWHEYLLMPLYYFARPDIHVLISRHADAQIIVELCRYLGVPAIRGSTTHGGAEAIRQLLRVGRETHLAITTDGPRGPRRQVQQGIIYLAGEIGMPVVPVGFGVRRPWRMGSWDRFALPRPWSRASIVQGSPIVVPANAAKEEREHYRQLVETSLLELTDLAERWAENGSWPIAEPAATSS